MERIILTVNQSNEIVLLRFDGNKKIGTYDGEDAINFVSQLSNMQIGHIDFLKSFPDAMYIKYPEFDFIIEDYPVFHELKNPLDKSIIRYRKGISKQNLDRAKLSGAKAKKEASVKCKVALTASAIILLLSLSGMFNILAEDYAKDTEDINRKIEEMQNAQAFNNNGNIVVLDESTGRLHR